MSFRQLPEVLQQKAENELNEIPSRRRADIDHILDWISKQPHMKAKTDDQTILNFLRHAKFSLERAKEKLENYYTIKSMLPELFTDRDPFSPIQQEILNRKIMAVVVDPLDPLCPAVIVVHWGRADPACLEIMDVVKATLMSMEIAINEYDSIIVNGFHFLIDYGGIDNMYFVQVTPTVVKKTVLSMTDMFPLRMKGDHVVNVAPLAEKIVNFFKSFLKDKLSQRFHVYHDLGLIRRDIPLSVLPEEYGGTAGSLDNIAVQWKAKVESYREWFLEDEIYRNDESKRVGKPKTTADLTGVEGSFRKLQRHHYPDFLKIAQELLILDI